MPKCVHSINNDKIKIDYPIQDLFWPSRRWNNDREYCDLSGCNCKPKTKTKCPTKK